jgi:3',5'-cyclic AMP phosphodiesterase CpdA
MKIVYLTDSHLDEPAPARHGANTRKNWTKTVTDVKAQNPDLVIFGGDIGTAQSQGDFFRDLSPFRLRLTLGNHDHFDEVARYYDASRSKDEMYDYFQTDGFTFVFLDSSSGGISQTQLSWFERVVENAERLLVFVHHPVLGIDSVVDRKYPLKNRDAVKEILTRRPKPAIIFCGHNHCADQTREQNISQYMTPAVSYQILKGTDRVVADVSYFGYRIIELRGTDVETQVVALKP